MAELPVPPPLNNPITTNTKSNSNLFFGIFLGALFGILLAVGVFFYLNANKDKGNQTAVEAKPTTVVPTSTPTPTPDAYAGWETFSNATTGLSLRYPPEIKIFNTTTQSEFGKPGDTAIRLTLLGPKQTEGTELADGMNISLGVVTKTANQTLKSFAEENSKVDENVASKEPLEEVSLAGLSGYKTTIHGLGTFDYYFLPIENKPTKVLWVTKIANSDTETKRSQYENTFEKIMASVKFGQ